MTETYGERVAHARVEMGLTQEEFAARVGIPKRTLQDIESGISTKPQRKTREKIDAVIGLHSPEETENDWPTDLRAYLRLEGAFLAALSETERTTYIDAQIVRLATWRNRP